MPSCKGILLPSYHLTWVSLTLAVGSGGAAERRYPASEVRGGDERSYLASEVRGCDERRYPVSKVRGSGREELPHVQGAVAAQAPEGLEELFHVQGREGRQ